MRRVFAASFIVLAAFSLAFAVAKPHVVTFGKVMPVKLFLGPSEETTMDIKVRPLYVDSKIKEFTTGEPHDVTDHMFVVRRVYRINDNLPEEERKLPKWMWQRGGWLLVDRTSGRVAQVSLPDFDPYYSDASWYRDLAAYCGISDNAEKLYAVVFQLGRRKPLLRRELGRALNGEGSDSECAAPQWDRQPARVTFQPRRGEKVVFTVPGHMLDIAPATEEE